VPHKRTRTNRPSTPAAAAYHPPGGRSATAPPAGGGRHARRGLQERGQPAGELGRRLGSTTAPASRAGYAQLLAWARGLGEVTAWGVEGTGSYGAGLARFLAAGGQRVVEVNRPDRQLRRRRGKSDSVDADAAARTVQAGEATGLPKAQDGTVEMVRALRVARQTAVKARTQAVNAIRGLLVTVPAELGEQLDGLPTPSWSARLPRWHPAR
jgi:transposase